MKRFAALFLGLASICWLSGCCCMSGGYGCGYPSGGACGPCGGGACGAAPAGYPGGGYYGASAVPAAAPVAWAPPYVTAMAPMDPLPTY